MGTWQLKKLNKTEKRSLIPWGYTVPIFGPDVHLGTLKSYEVEGNPGRPAYLTGEMSSKHFLRTTRQVNDK